MGQSTDAVLAYGYAWQSDDVDLLNTHNDDTEDDYEEWEETVLRRRGITRGDEDYGAWRERVKAVREEYGVSIGSHCSCEYPIPYIYVIGTRYQAYRGMAKVIEIVEQPTREWDAKLQKFIDDLGISLEDPEYGDPVVGPGWFLVSMWC